MRLKPDQLKHALKKLSAVYLVTGDEPLQTGEAADAIRKAAKQAGYITREILSVEPGFVWNELALTADSMSLFSDKKLIDLRIPSGKPGIDGAKAISEYCQRLPEDTLLLITSPKLTAATLKSKWCQAIDRVGTIVQIWPVDGVDLIKWLQGRAQARGLQIESEGIRSLAARTEGNLLAASQEIEKLYILHGESAISKQALETAVADSSRFDVFKLTDCILSGRITRTTKILNGLKAEGVAAPVIVWALARETRMLINIKHALKQGQNKESVFKQNKLWDKRKSLVNATVARMKMPQLHQALSLNAKADRQIKGQEKGDYWETLLSACLLFSQ